MHVYKRKLSPIKENYAFVSPASPFQDNFIVFSNTEGGLFDTMSHFKEQLLNSNENVKVMDCNTKKKNFQTFSLIETREKRRRAKETF
jgi:thiamine phosphate synthase YjbQ (UPF0047 family)